MKNRKRTIVHRIVAKAGSKQWLNFLPDDKYLKLMFWARMNRKLDLNHPYTINEKIQWLKLFDRNKEYVQLVDKYSVRSYIEKKLGEEYLIPLVGGPWNTFEEIDFSSLPRQFVLKCTHDSGGLVICQDKDKLDLIWAKKKINKSLKNNYYWSGREWPYKNVRPQIIAEKFMLDDSNEELKDYKILCFNGKPDNIMVCTGRFQSGVKYYFFDKEWNFLRYQKADEDLPTEFSLPKPKHLDDMLRVAELLSKGMQFSRIDLYEANDRVYFGEITLYPDSGFDTDISFDTDVLFGEKLNLISKEYVR